MQEITTPEALFVIACTIGLIVLLNVLEDATFDKSDFDLDEDQFKGL